MQRDAKTQESTNRREALKLFLAGAGCFAAQAASAPFEPAAAQYPLGDVTFPTGVASGDPQPGGVVLWTRALSVDGSGAPVNLIAEVALDPEFTQLVAAEPVLASADSDHTVRLYVSGLAPATTYFYRFRAGSSISAPLGRTRTAPEPGADVPIVLATASCQNYQAGSFAAYRKMIADDEARAPEEQIHAVLHLGDFIYESIYLKRRAKSLSDQTGIRSIEPFPSGGKRVPGAVHADSVDDYRHLYKTYLSDPDLIAARARWPFICTWDDHEFANDSWQSHDTYGEAGGAPAQRRKVAANQAWFEYIPALLTGARSIDGETAPARDFAPAEVSDAPIGEVDSENRSVEPNNLAAIHSMTIYRAVRMGRHVELVVSDARSYRSDHPIPEDFPGFLISGARRAVPAWMVEVLDAGFTARGGNPPKRLRVGGLTHPNPRWQLPPGTMLGPDQKAWWKEAMAASDATWKLWASSVPVMPLRLDAQKLYPLLDNMVMSTDAWEGYPGERAELMEYLEEKGITNVVVLSGDHHASFAGYIPDRIGRRRFTGRAVEFSTSGISSLSMYSMASASRNPLAKKLTSFRPKARKGESRKRVNNLNTTILYGAKVAAVAAQTGNLGTGMLFRNRGQNPHITHVDTDAYGFCVLTISGQETRAEHVTLSAPRNLAPEMLPSEVNRIRYRVSAWAPGEAPKLEGPDFIGPPPFPIKGWKS